MKISIQKNKKPKQIWLDVVKFSFFGKQKLQTNFKLKYGSFTWGDTPKGAPLDGWFGVRS